MPARAASSACEPTSSSSTSELPSSNQRIPDKSPTSASSSKLKDPIDVIAPGSSWEAVELQPRGIPLRLSRPEIGKWRATEQPRELKRVIPGRFGKNPLRKIQRHKRLGGARYGGGLMRTRRMLGERLLERLQPNTNPVDEVSDIEVDGDVSDRENQVPEEATQDNTGTNPPRPSRAPGIDRPETKYPRRVRRKMHKDDMDPYPDDFYAHLTGEDYPDMTTDDLLIGGDSDLPPDARKCPIDVRRMIRNAHSNLGHPSNHAMVRFMKTAKCHPDMIAYARHMKCPSCQRRQPPARIPKVSMPYRPTRFNAVVGLDLKWVKDSKGEKYFLLNILDLATAFNVCVIVKDKIPATIAEAFKMYWMNWAGTPEKVVADKGTEYYTDFQHMMSDLGIAYRLVPIEAPWQHGMVERHGQVLSDIIQAVTVGTEVQGTKQMQDLVLHTCMAKNRRPGRTGYSPRSLVFGLDERLIASGLNHYLEQPDEASIHASQTDPAFKKSMDIRKEAMKALIDLDHAEKWKDAIQFPSRKAHASWFLPGTQVFFWKKSPGQANLKGKRARIPERWYGPGVVIGHEWDQTAQRDSYWVSYGGKCFLVAGTHMRHAEFEECLVQEKFVQEMQKAFEEVQTPTFQYYDVRRDQVDPEEVTGQRSAPNLRGDGPAYAGDGLLMRLAESSPAGGIIYPQTSHAPRSPPPVPSEPRTPRRLGTPAEPASEPAGLISPPSHYTGTSPAESRMDAEAVAAGEPGEVLYTDKVKNKEDKNKQTVYSLRGANHVLIVDEVTNECYFLKWKTFNKMQRKGKELDPKFFNDQERMTFNASDAKEWQSFLDTGAVVVIPPNDASRIPQSRIFGRPMRYVRTNKNKEDEGTLEAKSRIVTPGDVDPDGDIPVEEGGFRTDAPTCPQVAFHMLCSQAVLKRRRLGVFDCKTAFLTGKTHDRDIYCRPPKEGLPGVLPGSLLKLVKGAYGLREAPRLWYLKAREILQEAGFEEMQTGRACFCVYDRSGKEPVNVGMLVLHVDDACFAGEGPMWEKAMQRLRSRFTIGKEEYDDFTFLGRHVVQKPDCSIEIDQHEYVKSIQRVPVLKERRSKPKETLSAKELHDYRSLVGQLAWPARESMPQLAYSVSDLQQKVAKSTVGDLVHANNVLNQAKRQVAQGQKLLFQHLGVDTRIELQHSHRKPTKDKKVVRSFPKELGLAAVHDASFMGQPGEGSQMAYCLMLCSTELFEGKSRTHLLDWGSSKIHRKMRSTLASEAASAARAFDRGAYARVMLYEIEQGWRHKWERLDQDGGSSLRHNWSKMCQKIPFALGTDCKSLYDVCTKNGSMPEERRVALDLMDVRESIEEMGDQIRWIPTDHMLVDCMTKTMPPDAMMSYLKNMEYAFKYDDVIKQTKREVAKQRKAAREKLLPDKLPKDEQTYDEYDVNHVNVLEHYHLYLPMFQFLYHEESPVRLTPYDGDFEKLKEEQGFRSAYTLVVSQLCSGA